MGKDEMKKTLKSNVARVVFEKLDGTIRDMRCTLMDTYLPEVVPGSNTKVRAENEDVLCVWDIDKSAWRSFRMDSIKSITVGP